MNKKIIWVLILAIVVIGGGLLYYNSQAKVAKEVPDKVVVKKEPIAEVDKDTAIVEPKDDKSTTEIATGKPAPDFTLKNLEGEDVSLSDYKGKLVLLNFWATWCGYCDLEMPDLQKLDAENEDLVVLAIDVQEDRDIVQEYITDGGYTFEVALDQDGSLAQTYLVSGYPTSYFIDKEGLLIGAVPGMMTYEQMNEVLTSIR